MRDIKKCKIDLSKISNEDKEIIGRRFLDCVNDYFSKPGVEEKFQKWLAQRKQNLV